jgi:hypothetical protein
MAGLKSRNAVVSLSKKVSLTYSVRRGSVAITGYLIRCLKEKEIQQTDAKPPSRIGIGIIVGWPWAGSWFLQ